MNTEPGFEKGHVCNRDGCTGIIQERNDGTYCSCHLNPPCSHCVDSIERMHCPICDWSGQDERDNEPPTPQPTQEQRDLWAAESRRWDDQRDLFYLKYNTGKDIKELEIRNEQHTHFTQIMIGIFPKGTETMDSVLPKIKGTFGGRFELFSDYRFKYIAYTD